MRMSHESIMKIVSRRKKLIRKMGSVGHASFPIISNGRMPGIAALLFSVLCMFVVAVPTARAEDRPDFLALVAESRGSIRGLVDTERALAASADDETKRGIKDHLMSLL